MVANIHSFATVQLGRLIEAHMELVIRIKASFYIKRNYANSHFKIGQYADLCYHANTPVHALTDCDEQRTYSLSHFLFL